MDLEEIAIEIEEKYGNIFECVNVDNDTIICEGSFEYNGCKNDDDCCDQARENGEMIIENFPMLEISNYYCHRHKYAIVELKLKELA
jgi:hypothetical protein